MSKSKFNVCGAVGRSDLVELLAKYPDAPPETLASMLGYEYTPVDFALSTDEPDSVLPDKGQGTEDHVVADGWSSILNPRFWVVKEREVFEKEEGSSSSGRKKRKQSSLPELPRATFPPPVEPIVPWKRLWPLLKRVLEGNIRSRQPDERETLRVLSKGDPLTDIPLKKRKTWASFSQIIMDASKRLSPYREDFHELIYGVGELSGFSHLRICHLVDGPLRAAYYPANRERKPVEIDLYGAPLLILSDLGVYGSAVDRAQWLEFGRSLQNLGVRAVVLTPAPENMWTDECAKLFRLVCWDDHATLPHIYNSEAWEGMCCVGGDVPKQTEALLTLLSPAVYIDPGLVRLMRGLLPEAGVGIEALVWTHETVETSYTSIAFIRSQQKDYREKFGELAAELREQALRLIESHHTFLPSEVQLEERLTLHVLRREYAPQTIMPDDVAKYLEWLGGCLDRPGGRDASAIQAWVKRMCWRQLDEFRSVEGAEELCKTAAIAFKKELEAYVSTEIPTFMKEIDIPKGNVAMSQVNIWLVRQVGDVFYLAKESLEGQEGRLIGYIRGQKFIKIKIGAKEQKFIFSNVFRIALPVNEDVILSSSLESVSFSSEQKPIWAESIYRDASGLYATLPLNDSKIKHVLPRSVPDLSRFFMHDKRFKNNIEKAFWLNMSQLEQILKSEIPDTKWAETYGFDQYGLYADLNIEGVTQRMRWIQPGTFMMGSPEDEVGRDSGEKQHEVTLSKGYWLADTACTQELWGKIMEYNPSEFKEEGQLPVENISWDSCQLFLQSLNNLYPLFRFKLPTESKWRYACRAGTETSFSFGDDINTDQVNYNGWYPYNRGSKGGDRGRTVSVKALPCNQWGVYQMHGNVWEWCSDSIGEERSRVMCGGSWVSGAAGVRSSSRYVVSSSSNYYTSGFRLCRDA